MSNSLPPCRAPSECPQMRRTTSCPPASLDYLSKSRVWQPKGAVAITCVDGRMGEGKINGLEKGAERGLSSLYVQNERIVAVSADSDKPPGKRGGWKKSLVDGAVNATVMGAALGVTAYRLWTSNVPLSTPDDCTPEAGPSGTVHASIDNVPPPAYEETIQASSSHVHRPSTQSVKIISEWMDDDITEIFTPTPSRCSTGPRLRRHHSNRHKSSRPRMGKTSRQRGSITVQEDPFDRLNEDQTSSSSTRFGVTKHFFLEGQPSVDEDGEADVPELEEAEVIARLDIMALRLRNLVLEGQAALASSSPILSPSKDREDESPRLRRRMPYGVKSLDKPQRSTSRNALATQRRTASMGEREVGAGRSRAAPC